MFRTTTMLALAALVAAAMPTVSASHCSDGPAADPATAVGVEGVLMLYVTEDLQVFQETNGHAGLQMSGGICTQKNSGRDVPFDADAQIALP